MERFKDYLGDHERRNKLKTAQVYRSALRQFNIWLETQDKRDFDDKDITTFLDERLDLANESKNTLLKALKGWAKYARARVPVGVTFEQMQQGRELEKKCDRIIGIKSYTVYTPEKVALSLEQIRSLFDVLDSDIATIFWILLWFGLRLNEIKRIQGVNWEEKSIVIATEKTLGHRTLYFDDYTAKILHHAIDSGLLAWHGQKIWAKLKYYSSVVEPAKLTPHLARHCFASHFVNNVTRDELRIMLGHRSDDCTGIYVHPAQERIRDIMQNKHFLKLLEPKVE